MTNKNLLKRKGGFTLIELIVVIAILGILAAVIIPRFGGFQDRARSTQALVEAKQVATAIDVLQAESDDGAFPLIADADEIYKLAFGSTDADLRKGSFSADPDEDGGFEWTVDNANGDDWVAGRTGTGAVEMK